MNIVNYKYILFLLFFFLVVLPIYSLPAFSHEGTVHEIVDTSEEQKMKIQECLALPEFQDSCYIDLCGEEGTYFCTEDILDAVVELAGPQKAMDVLNGIMQSSLFAIQTDGHLLSHIIGNSIAHHYGFLGESFLLCPSGFRWGCAHGFFEDAIEVQENPVEAATEICESAPEHPKWLKDRCYHGVGHIFMFNESNNLTSALSLCEGLPSLIARENCYQGVFMEKNEVIDEFKEELGFRDDDILAPCNRIDNKYRSQCYINHGYYFLHKKKLSMKDASYACLDAGHHADKCIIGLAIMTTNPVWQERFLKLSPIQSQQETTLLENAVYLCGMVPPDYIEQCHVSGLAHLIGSDHIQEGMNFCLLPAVSTSRCFRHIGAIFSSTSTSTDHAIERCGMAPQEYRDDCIGGTKVDAVAAEQRDIQQRLNDEEQSVSHQDENQMIQHWSNADYTPEQPSSSVLLYLFIGLGCILLTTPLVYHFYRKR